MILPEISVNYWSGAYGTENIPLQPTVPSQLINAYTRSNA